MTDLKCPYCPEVRGTRGRLSQHVDGMHRTVPFTERNSAVATARIVETTPAVDTVDATGRDQPTDRLTENAERLNKTQQQFTELREALDRVDAQMSRIDRQLNSPATVRHATLCQAWDRLIEAGNVSGALIISAMIKEGS